MAPGLVGPEKAARGKTPTDVWWQTIVSPTGTEKTGYPTQKPLKVLERIVRVHSDPGDLVLDFFAGSGTTGEAAARLGRHYLLVDSNPEAVRVMSSRLAWDAPEVFSGERRAIDSTACAAGGPGSRAIAHGSPTRERQATRDGEGAGSSRNRPLRRRSLPVQITPGRSRRSGTTRRRCRSRRTCRRR